MSDDDKPGAEERKAKAFLQDAYALETEANTLAFYDRWADEYDAQLERGLHYIAPRRLAEALARYQAVGDDPILPFDDAAYAAAISTGTFTLGHVGPEPIDEVLRVLMPGAYFACTVHQAIWDSQGFSRKFADLEKRGAIRVVEQVTGSFFEGGEPAARYCVFQKP